MIFIFDLDGTLTDHSHRLHYIKGDSVNWKKYADECDKDVPIQSTILVLRALKNDGHTVVILTGRTARVRDRTELWLDIYNVPYDKLIMRPENNYKPDTEYKKEAIERNINGEIKAIFDDRLNMVNFWRSEGYQCYDVGRVS